MSLLNTTTTCAAKNAAAHYSRPVNLRRFDSIHWMTAEEDLWAIRST